MLTPGGGYTVHEVCLWEVVEGHKKQLVCTVMDKFNEYTTVNPAGLILIVLLTIFLCWYLYYDRNHRYLNDDGRT